jgi:hypothetical protein
VADSAVASHRAPIPPTATGLLGSAWRCLRVAAEQRVAGERYAAAHLAALRGASAVLDARTRPESTRGRRIRTAWSLLAQVAPELGEWAAFFAAGAGKRAAAEAGLHRAVTVREADDLLRAAETFLVLVEGVLVSGQQVLPGVRASRAG